MHLSYSHKKTCITLLLVTLCCNATEEKIASPVAKKIKNMTDKEVATAYTYYKTHGYKELAIEALERMRSLATQDDEQKRILLDLADAYKHAEQYEKAQKKYEDYVSFYPGSDQAQRALYEAVFTSYKQIPDYQRDQEPTEKTIELAKKFLSTYPAQSSYTEEIETMLKKSYRQLLKHEESICSYYIQKHSWSAKKTALSAARIRIDSIKQNLLKHVPEAQAVIDKLEALLSQAEIPAPKNRFWLF